MAFKMKGHTLPGINQRSETKNMADGRSKSSAFQKNGDKKKKSYPADYTDEEIDKVVKRNMKATNIQSINELVTRQDSVYSGVGELEKRFKKKNKKSPATKLKGKQHKIDMNKDGKISKEDFNMMNSSPAKMYGKKSPAKNYKKGYYKK
tara:strand:- start:55 stop:501 length:447 start_codon:yes stop_codon:yes gene_type:complete